jgi:hypothetical protein
MSVLTCTLPVALAGALATLALAGPARAAEPQGSPVLAAASAAAPAAAAAQAPEAMAPNGDLYLRALRAIAENRTEDAAELLTQFLQSEPEHAGAWLDLAISQCELGRAADAERLFDEITTRFAPPPGIMDMISQHRAQGCAAPAFRTQYALSASLGYDNNVNQGASSRFFGTGSDGRPAELDKDFLPKADRYTQLNGEISRPIGHRSTVGFGQVRLRRHASVRDQDTSSVLMGVDQSWQLASWQGRATAAVGWLELGGRYYQRQSQLQLRTYPPVPLPSWLDWSTNLGVVRTTYPTRIANDGTTSELGTMLSTRGMRWQGVVTAGINHDHGEEGRLGGDRKGWYTSGLLYGPLGSRLKGQFSLSRQHWRGTEAYAPNVIDDIRHQDTTQLSATVTLPLQGRHSLQLEWRGVRNRENISLFQYNSRSIQLNWRWDHF